MKNLNAWIKKTPVSQLTCRDLLHSWEDYAAKQIPSGFERTLACDRCGCLKVQTLSKHGQVLRSNIRYDSSYLLPKGAGRLDRQDKARIRVAIVRTQLRKSGRV